VPMINIPIAEAALYWIRRKMTSRRQSAGQVADVEQREPDAGLGGSLYHRMTHGIGIRVRTAVLIVVQIVELPYDCVSGPRHLDEYRAGEGEVGIGIQPGRERIHLLPPSPEAAASGMRSAPEPAVEGMAVAVGQTGERYAVQDLLTGSRFDANS